MTAKKGKDIGGCTRCDGYGKEFKKELLGSAVVLVADGKVEIWRKVVMGMGLRWG
jgi:hypothetical protein